MPLSEHEKAMRSQKRDRLMERGICRQCLQTPVTIGPRGGTSLCDACREYHAQKRAARSERERNERAARPKAAQLPPLRPTADRYQRQRAAGICSDCGVRPATLGPQGGITLCDECRVLRRNRDETSTKRSTKRLRDDRAEAGLCVYCGNPVVIPGPRGSRRWCADCREQWLLIRSDRLDRRDAIEIYGGACADCGITDVRVLEFHHTNHDGYLVKRKNGGGSGRFARQISRSGARIDGIDMICANCHRIRHWDVRYADNVFT